LKLFNPLVSIVIPVFNGSDYLSYAIISALNQTYKNIEILVINDGSNDDRQTELVALSFGDRIKYLQKPNGGVASALNVALEHINGEYFSWLSHDDCYSTNKIEEQIKFLTNISSFDRDKVIVYSDFSVFHKNLEEVSPVITEEVHAEDFTYWLAINSRLHGCSLLLPRTVMIAEGGFKEGLQTTQDYEFWFRLSLKYEFHQLKKNLLFSRQHPNQTSVILSETAKIEGRALHKYFLTQLEIYNKKKNHRGKDWERYTLLTFSMLRKKYISTFFFGFNFMMINLKHLNFSEKMKILQISLWEITKLPLYLIYKFLLRNFIYFVRSVLVR
jgi:glycosyltransferase involved in cell wall biosynthesis